MYLLPLVRLAGFARKHPCWSKRHLSNSWPFVCLFCQLTVRQAYVEARRTARTAAGAEGRRSSVAARPLLRRRRLRRQAAGWPAAGAGGPVAGAALAPETETGGKGLLSEPHWAVWLQSQSGVSNEFKSMTPNTDAFVLTRRLFMWQFLFIHCWLGLS